MTLELTLGLTVDEDVTEGEGDDDTGDVVTDAEPVPDACTLCVTVTLADSDEVTVTEANTLGDIDTLNDIDIDALSEPVELPVDEDVALDVGDTETDSDVDALNDADTLCDSVALSDAVVEAVCEIDGLDEPVELTVDDVDALGVTDAKTDIDVVALTDSNVLGDTELLAAAVDETVGDEDAVADNDGETLVVANTEEVTLDVSVAETVDDNEALVVSVVDVVTLTEPKIVTEIVSEELDEAVEEAVGDGDELGVVTRVAVAEGPGVPEGVPLGDGTTAGGAREGEGTFATASVSGIVAFAQMLSAAKVAAKTLPALELLYTLFRRADVTPAPQMPEESVQEIVYETMAAMVPPDAA